MKKKRDYALSESEKAQMGKWKCLKAPIKYDKIEIDPYGQSQKRSVGPG